MSPTLVFARSRPARSAALVLLLAGWIAGADAAANPASTQLAKLADDYFETRLALFSLSATEEVGDPRFEGELEIEIAPAHRARQRAAFEQALRNLRTVDAKALNPSERVTYDLIQFDATQRLEALRFPRHLLPFSQIDSVPTRLAQWGSGQSVQPFKTVQNYENYLKRLERISAWVDQAMVNMREGMKGGVVLQRPLVERALPQFKSLAEGDVETSAYFQPVKQFPAGFSESDKARLRTAYRDAIANRVIPALKAWHAFMETEYLPRAGQHAGLSALQDGAAWYQSLVRESTTTSMTVDEIHALGLAEVARIRAEMEGVRIRVGHTDELNSLLASVNTRPDLTPFTTEEEIIARLRAYDAKVVPQLSALFGLKPKAPFEIRPVDALVKDSASSSYILPAMDGSRPGIFYVAVPDPKQFVSTEMAALLLHEGQPGHHFQMALQQELDIPRMRRFLWLEAYGEGWGLYAESLGRDLGVYDDPFSYLGRLQMELHRAVRLVTDTGLHAKGWTREATIRYMMDTQGITEPTARRATERYMAWPGQALAYKIDELKILELRQRARQRLGTRFDIRGFHDEVLGAGPMPLSMLEARIDAWIQRSART